MKIKVFNNVFDVVLYILENVCISLDIWTIMFVLYAVISSKLLPFILVVQILILLAVITLSKRIYEVYVTRRDYGISSCNFNDE